jgi:D-arabinose 1-dehydrogenase-like Zn-dependent alcohol dehydrogenase
LLILLGTFCRLLQTVLNLYKDGSIKPISSVTKFHPSGIKEAFQHLHANRRIGATCIEFPQDPKTISANFFADQSSFRADRAYLLVGGLGGLGKSAAMWLAERGAGHVIFLSRSATKHATANAGFLCELRALGCSVEVVAGNAADTATIERVAANSPKPIAGVVHLPVVVWVCSSPDQNSAWIFS